MNYTGQSPFDPLSPGHSRDHLDELLRTFFRSEMPRPWPAFEPPLMPAPLERHNRPLRRSRLVLAASLAILLLGAWLLAGAFRNAGAPTGGPGSGDFTAKPGVGFEKDKMPQPPAP